MRRRTVMSQASDGSTTSTTAGDLAAVQRIPGWASQGAEYRTHSLAREECRARARMHELQRMQATGRSLLLQREMAVHGRWWTEFTWRGILKAMPKWVAQLESWKKGIEVLEEQLRKIEAELRAEAPGELIFGESELTGPGVD